MVLRKLAVALLSVGVMLPGLGHALAVRDLQTKSALGEPYQGEIELVEIGDLNADEIKVSLATQEDFERLGVERVYFLTDLRFDVILNTGGRSYVKITSAKPVREPFLDFVVRIAWPGNTRLQGVTALLDPPVLADAAPQEVERPLATQPVVSSTVQSVEPIPSDATEAPAPVVPPAPARPIRQPAPAQAAQPQPVPQADSYRTRAGDTMHKVAQQLRPSDAVSVSQTMIAIQRANPQAFVGDNINQLKRGQVLRVPSESQIREISAQEAAASIREQAQQWRSSHTPVQPVKQALDVQQVDATAPQVAPKVAVPVAKPEMKLLAQSDKAGASAAGKEQGAVAPADAKKLDENRVKAAAAKAEKEKLAAKVGTLDAKVKTNDQKLEVQNAKLAELQAKLKDQQAKAEAAKAEAAKQAAAKVDAAKTAIAKVEAAPQDKSTATAEQLDAVTSPDAVVPAQTDGAEVAPVVEAQPLPTPAPVAAAPVVEEEAESGVSPLLVGGGVLALLGGIAGFIWNKRRREKAEEEEALAELEAMDEIGGEADTAESFAFAGLDQDDRGADEFSLPSASAAEVDTPAFAVAQDRVLADPLEEVEQYLAFERFPQAAGFLVKAIAANPDRADLRLKLSEVYARLDDHKGFAEQLNWFEAQGDLDSLAQAEEFKASMSPAPVEVDHDDLGMLEYESNKSVATAHDDLTSLEDLEMDFNASVSASSPSLKAVSDEDLSFAAPAAKAADSGLSLDEDLDFSFDSKPATAAASAADELSFDLDVGDFESATPATASTPSADFDMDFSLDEVSLDEPKLEASTSGLGLGEIELADFDVAPAAAPSAPAATASVVDDDLNFGLDDLEVVAAEPAAAESFDLEGDFNLDETPATDLSFDETMQADSGMNDAVADFDAALNLDAVAAEPVAAPTAAPTPEAAAIDDEFDFLADTDENATKLDLARAYIDMGDMEGARDILQEVLNEGNAPQKDEAKGLLAQVG
jgi:pilus assembly protein FimV